MNFLSCMFSICLSNEFLFCCSGSWGTVCDRYFSGQEANTVCKQLGYRNGATVYRGTFFGEGKGPVWLDDFQCCSGDNELTSCRNLDWGKSDCLHSRDVGVECGELGHINLIIRFLSLHLLALSARINTIYYPVWSSYAQRSGIGIVWLNCVWCYSSVG